MSYVYKFGGTYLHDLVEINEDEDDSLSIYTGKPVGVDHKATYHKGTTKNRRV